MSKSLLHRWSKQKAEVTDEELPSTEIQDQETEIDTASDAEASASAEIEQTEQTEQEEKAPVELPPIESLGEDSDYSLFMSPEVDEKLKKLALRKLFKTPAFNVVDGLNDYDDDFTTFELLGDIVTSDMKFHEERKKAEEALKRQQADESGEVSEPIESEALGSEQTEEEEPTGTNDETLPSDEDLVAKDVQDPEQDSNSDDPVA
ncbi:MAG: DUF3306 domain-containing protein [Gammaproteobacteria bacterium]|nr:DUF3306 domain-containing protein [Gammaproteobacteria bacterium]